MPPFKIFFWFVKIFMMLVSKSTLAFVIITSYTWLKLKVPYSYCSYYNAANWQEDNSNQTKSQKASNLKRTITNTLWIPCTKIKLTIDGTSKEHLPNIFRIWIFFNTRQKFLGVRELANPTEPVNMIWRWKRKRSKLSKLTELNWAQLTLYSP